VLISQQGIDPVLVENCKGGPEAAAALMQVINQLVNEHMHKQLLSLHKLRIKV
jgi:hypothetical protein